MILRCICRGDGSFDCYRGDKLAYVVKKIWVKEIAFKVLATLITCDENVEVVYIRPKLAIKNKNGELEVWL
jgi:hypothetical protein